MHCESNKITSFSNPQYFPQTKGVDAIKHQGETRENFNESNELYPIDPITLDPIKERLVRLIPCMHPMSLDSAKQYYGLEHNESYEHALKKRKIDNSMRTCTVCLSPIIMYCKDPQYSESLDQMTKLSKKIADLQNLTKENNGESICRIQARLEKIDERLALIQNTLGETKHVEVKRAIGLRSSTSTGTVDSFPEETGKIASSDEIKPIPVKRKETKLGDFFSPENYKVNQTEVGSSYWSYCLKCRNPIATLRKIIISRSKLNKFDVVEIYFNLDGKNGFLFQELFKNYFKTFILKVTGMEGLVREGLVRANVEEAKQLLDFFLLYCNISVEQYEKIMDMIKVQWWEKKDLWLIK